MDRYTISIWKNGDQSLYHKDVTPAQVSIVTAVLRDPTLTYGEVLEFFAHRRIGLDNPVGAGEDVEAFRG